jgi:hypothetical protein
LLFSDYSLWWWEKEFFQGRLIALVHPIPESAQKYGGSSSLSFSRLLPVTMTTSSSCVRSNNHKNDNRTYHNAKYVFDNHNHAVLALTIPISG